MPQKRPASPNEAFHRSKGVSDASLGFSTSITLTLTVSETVSENCKTVRKNSGQLERFLFETSIELAILLALNQCCQFKSDNWLHS